MADPVSAELDPAVAEGEGRRAREAAIGVGIVVLVPCAIDPEIVAVLETLRMGQEHDADREGSKTELAITHYLAYPTNAAAPVTETELCRNDQDVARLLLDHQIERVRRASVSPQPRRGNLALAVVVERTRLRDLHVHELNGPAVLLGIVGDLREVLRGDGAHQGNREPAFRSVGELRQILGVLQGMVQIETKDLGNGLNLVVDRLRPLVPLWICVAGAHFLVSKLITF